MKSKRVEYILLFITSISLLLLTSPVYETHNNYVQETINPLGQLPRQVALMLPLEFDGITADILFLQTITFMGSKIGAHKSPTPAQWQLMDSMLHLITDFDGKFLDPYIFAEMMFPWQAGMVDEANILLLKAIKSLPNDYRPYYFLGFNYFYFQKDFNNAAKYLRKSAQLPDSPDYIKGLAARFSLYGNQTGLGIIFLDHLIKETSNETTRKYLKKRLTTLKIIYYLEMKVKAYKKKTKKLPKTLDELIKEKIITQIPEDPYGGSFYIMNNGRIFTTSNLLSQRKTK